MVMCITDENGERIFTDQDVKAVMDLPAPGVMRAFNEAGKINGLGNEELDEAMAVFDGTQDGDSGTN